MKELTGDSICTAISPIFLQKLKQISHIVDSKLLENKNAVNPMYAIKYTMVTAKMLMWKYTKNLKTINSQKTHDIFPRTAKELSNVGGDHLSLRTDEDSPVAYP